MTDDTPPAWAKDLMVQVQEVRKYVLGLRTDVQQTATSAMIDELCVALMACMDRLQAAVEARHEDES